MSQLSTAGSVPTSVYKGFRLFMLLRRRSRDVFSVPWRVRGTLVPSANCSLDVPSCPAPSLRPVVRPGPTCPWYVRVLHSTSILHPRHVQNLSNPNPSHTTGRETHRAVKWRDLIRHDRVLINTYLFFTNRSKQNFPGLCLGRTNSEVPIACTL